jgi:hypothetical protein
MNDEIFLSASVPISGQGDYHAYFNGGLYSVGR